MDNLFQRDSRIDPDSALRDMEKKIALVYANDSGRWPGQ